MQTFLPYSDFEKSARCLDMRRLGKQRVEAKQIYLASVGSESGWKNHPAVKMWAGHVGVLADYGVAICDEWIRRGYRDSLRDWFAERWALQTLPARPWWLGQEIFHAKHRATLLYKNPEWYGQFGWTEEPKYEYWWPTKNASV